VSESYEYFSEGVAYTWAEPSWPRFHPYCSKVKVTEVPPMNTQPQANPNHIETAVTIGSVTRNSAPVRRHLTFGPTVRTQRSEERGLHQPENVRFRLVQLDDVLFARLGGESPGPTRQEDIRSSLLEHADIEKAGESGDEAEDLSRQSLRFKWGLR
jgi:hypothetical protein